MQPRILSGRPLCLLALSAAILLQACSESTTKEANTTGAVEARAQSEIELFPSNAPQAGATVLVEGRDFQGDCRIRIVFDGNHDEPLGTSGVGEKGEFAVQAVIPIDASAGEHELTIQGLAGPNCDQPSDNVARLDLDVKPPLPWLLIDTIEARPGGSVQVTGRGFCGDAACSPVMLLVDGAVVARDVDVGADGSFNVTAQVPAVDNAGEIMVVAIQTGAGGETLRGFGDLFVTVRPGGQRPVIL